MCFIPCINVNLLFMHETTNAHFDMCCSVHFYIASNSLKPTNAHFIMFGTLHVSLHISIHMDQGTTRLLHIFYTIHIRSYNSFVAKLSQNCIVCVKCMPL